MRTAQATGRVLTPLSVASYRGISVMAISFKLSGLKSGRTFESITRAVCPLAGVHSQCKTYCVLMNPVCNPKLKILLEAHSSPFQHAPAYCFYAEQGDIFFILLEDDSSDRSLEGSALFCESDNLLDLPVGGEGVARDLNASFIDAVHLLGHGGGAHLSQILISWETEQRCTHAVALSALLFSRSRWE